MSRDTKIALFIAAAAGLVLVAAGVLEFDGGGGVDVGGRAELKLDLGGDGDRHSRGQRHRRLDGQEMLTGPHPLYRRPRAASVHRTLLSVGGWEWYLNPPSEWTM
ncbi:hypothetical protein [Amycolatopsis alkalitolerans]|uniref:Uncharacterized protein n=1 Tax=Amycolatopsis alkalitolerans TaxID=2547244 RepID=A0A5C4LQC2_9PSEU|nr:hypothetical protein [Amycolatopsis alkalitolerans]TNC19072.1 hypothetical protein FG385_32925 [Amycolatopsis alkalitolerans]